IRAARKRQMVDPSIATAVLRLTPGSLFDDLNTFGFLFESLCARDLRVYLDILEGDLYHYRDSSGLESDFIIRLHDGRWAAVEVKMGKREIEEAAKHLLKLKKRIDTAKIGEPSFLMVLTAGPFAVKRPDGVLIVPLACLKP
ncbi:MAG: DUF4143 domain-containing protein, partial [Oxalobacter sp.]|nr:DUF4143 domain-containing protein [Oxalobacter sp.]